MKDCTVIALGGNAIVSRDEKGTIEEQASNLKKTAEAIIDVAREGMSVVVTHGNGPQIGAILIQNEMAKETVPSMPIDVCVAESQGLIGYLIEKALRDAAAERNLDLQIAAVLTQTLVRPDDPDFKAPSKPVGPFYDELTASRLAKEQGYRMIEDSGRGWRRVVPSPAPIEVIEAPTIRQLVEKGFMVIANGGGGIPVIQKDGLTIGVEAVIDKDLSSQKLATQIGASTLLLLTDVRKVYLNFGKPNQSEIDQMTAEEAYKYLRQGQFHKGSMEPKVRAAAEFVKSGGKLAAIGSLDDAYNTLKGRSGTRILSDRD